MIGAKEGRDPEENISDEISRDNNAEERALHPLLDDFDVLDRTPQGVEVGVAEDDEAAADDSQSIHDFELLVTHLSSRLRKTPHVLESGEATEEFSAPSVFLHRSAALSEATRKRV